MTKRADSLDKQPSQDAVCHGGKGVKKATKRGFFNAMANRLASTRLGDLLVDSGLISQDQLSFALKTQKGTQKKLGQVLIETGVISPVTLYRKLAEQWTIKTAAAGLTLMISAGSFAPRTASAQTYDSASASYSTTTTTNYKLDNISFPAMFGAKEVRSNDISGFKNWTGVLARFQRDLQNPQGNQQLMMLRSKLSKYKSMSLKDKVVAVNTLLNARPYVEDTRNYGKTDYWATPVEFLQRGGDCEDYAIAKYASLRALGVPADQMRVAIVLDKQLGIHHAILIVYDQNRKAYVLDNQSRTVRDLSTVTRYKPIYSINQQSWWLHKSA
tara:strand:- start:1262 stop:2245 length:984 start_codon:yes stop_codon:yes gene_type:complete